MDDDDRMKGLPQEADSRDKVDPKRKRRVLWLSDEAWEHLRKMAAGSEVTMSTFVEHSLTKHR
jgi:hypothetical protein